METSTLTLVARYSEITDNIKVSVTPEFLPEDSDPEEEVYAFAYTVRIENLSNKEIQLLERHWFIDSGGTQLFEIAGPGVVGEQPVLQSGDTFEYSSGAVIQDPFGAMKGFYTFTTASGEYLQAKIPEFDLYSPYIVMH